MKVLICGSRTYDDWQAIEYIILRLKNLVGTQLVIIEGEAKGADRIARNIAEAYEIEVEKYPAEWDKYGRAAGPIRNKQMLDEGKPDLVIGFSEDYKESKGTKNMLNQAIGKDKPTLLIEQGKRIILNKGDMPELIGSL